MRPMHDERPAFLVTMDVEGDNVWARRRETTTENARCVPRFHDLCRRFGIRPVYLTAYEMATCETFARFARAAVRRGEAEVGMHLHAWNTPPAYPLSADDHVRHPFATAYPADVLSRKIARLTDALETAVEADVRSHRGGRWAFDARYARALVERGYRVDSSVTPGVSWRLRDDGTRLDAGSAPDYSSFPRDPYFVDPAAIHRPGGSELLEVPVTTRTIDFGRRRADGAPASLVRWLRPQAHNRRALLSLAEHAIAEGRPCLVVTLHSSDLMPGGSPAACDPDACEALFANIESLFSAVQPSTRPMTLADFYQTAASLRSAADRQA